MNLEQVVRVIVNAVAKVLATEAIKLKAIAFNKANEDKLNNAMGHINKHGHIAPISEISTNDTDILFIDNIPPSYYAKLALGIADCPFTRLVQEFLLANKRICVLYSLTTANQTYGKLLVSYEETLQGYGIHFFDK